MKIVFDLDGTIIFKGQPMSVTITSAIVELQEKGHEVIFASARPVRDMLPVLDPTFHKGTLIGGNGSMVYQNGKLVASTVFPIETVDQLQALITEHKGTYLIDSDWDYAYTGPEDHPILQNVDPHKRSERLPLSELPSMIKVLILNADDMEELSSKLEDLDVVLHRHHKEDLIDLSPRGIHKWSALQKLGVIEGDYIAFGNDANDVTMFEHAARGIRVGDHPALEPFAQETVSPEEEAIVNKLNDLQHLIHTV